MYAYLALVIAVAAWGVHLALRWKQAREFAPELLKARQKSGELPEGINETEFTDLYLRAEGPRRGTYVYACAAFITLLLAFEVGTLIHTFSFFLAFFGLTVGLLAVAMHRYHTLTPPNLKQVMRTLRETHL